jgi:hypothetical protein
MGLRIVNGKLIINLGGPGLAIGVGEDCCCCCETIGETINVFAVLWCDGVSNEGQSAFPATTVLTRGDETECLDPNNCCWVGGELDFGLANGCVVPDKLPVEFCCTDTSETVTQDCHFKFGPTVNDEVVNIDEGPTGCSCFPMCLTGGTAAGDFYACPDIDDPNSCGISIYMSEESTPNVCLPCSCGETQDTQNFSITFLDSDFNILSPGFTIGGPGTSTEPRDGCSRCDPNNVTYTVTAGPEKPDCGVAFSITITPCRFDDAILGPGAFGSFCKYILEVVDQSGANGCPILTNEGMELEAVHDAVGGPAGLCDCNNGVSAANCRAVWGPFEMALYDIGPPEENPGCEDCPTEFYIGLACAV